MKRNGMFYLLTLAVGLLCSGWTFGMEASAAGPNPCSEDIAKFCGEITPGPAGMVTLMDCIEEHEKELSDACRNFEARIGGSRVEREETARERKQFRELCMNDMAQFCKDANPTKGGMMECLDEHTEQLSAPCRESIKAMR